MPQEPSVSSLTQGQGYKRCDCKKRYNKVIKMPQNVLLVSLHKATNIEDATVSSATTKS
jgi:hypothetical protein